tara:strand:+ start:330 stop:599 length:270 start_codon:yes stop_codon:yes gene_type:complete
MSSDKKSSFALIGSLTAWLITFATLVWTVAVKDANYSIRISTIETNMIQIESRMDEADGMRLNIATDLAGIKTDLSWIRIQLDKLTSRD